MWFSWREVTRCREWLAMLAVNGRTMKAAVGQGVVETRALLDAW